MSLSTRMRLGQGLLQALLGGSREDSAHLAVRRHRGLRGGSFAAIAASPRDGKETWNDPKRNDAGIYENLASIQGTLGFNREWASISGNLASQK